MQVLRVPGTDLLPAYDVREGLVHCAEQDCVTVLTSALVHSGFDVKAGPLTVPPLSGQFSSSQATLQRQPGQVCVL